MKFLVVSIQEKNEEFERAIAIVEKGLREIPRYGPLWFTAFRLHEKIEMETALQLDGSSSSTTATTRQITKPQPLQLFLRHHKQLLCILRKASSILKRLWVKDRVRTGDLRNHNPAL